MKKILLTLFSLAVLNGTAWAEGPQLFKQFYYGMPKAEVAQVSGATACEEMDLMGDLCMPGTVPFGGEEWEQVFVMDPEEKLSQVLLVQEANADVLDSMINVISGAGFIPVYLVADEEQLDIFSYASQGKQNELNERIMEILVNEPEEFSYTFLETKGLAKIKKSKLKNFLSVISSAPIDIRAVEAAMDNDLLVLNFSMPLMEQRDEARRSKHVQESF